MIVTVNGEHRTLPEGVTVDELVPRRRGVAVAVNRQIVPRSGWAEARLGDGDRVEILEAAQGG